MSERYTKLFALEKNLYTEGSPILICAGSLLYDSYTRNHLAQIKYKNISESVFKAVRIVIYMLDASGAPIGQPVKYSYLDLNAERDAEFGRNSAVILPSEEVRSFRVSICEVLTDKGEKWSCTDENWLPLAPFKTLAEAYQDSEIAAQFQIRYGSSCKYLPMEDRDLWLCTCGALNRSSERSCHCCRKVLSALKEINVNSLRIECSERLKIEKEQQAVVDAELKLKRKKYLRRAAIILPLLFLCITLIAYIPGAVKRSEAYSDAEALLAAGEYDKAREAFELLGNYRDSEVQAEKEVPYERAKRIMAYAEAGDDKGLKLTSVARSSVGPDDNISVILYNAAADEFKSLGDYKNSRKNIDFCLSAVSSAELADTDNEYKAAAELLEQKDYCLARDAFLALGDYKDSSEMAREAIYQKALSLYSFMESYDFRNIYAYLSTDTALPSRAYISQEHALEQGEDYITRLNSSFGKDVVNIDIKDMDEDLIPFSQAVSELFSQLDGYKDSAEYPEKIEILSDYTREFFNFIETGDLPSALDWLQDNDEDFENRETWTDRINRYLPLYGSWTLHSGDSSLVAASVGQSALCNTIFSTVIIGEDEIVLRLTVSDSDGISAELIAEPGSGSFYMNDESGNTYCAALNVFNRIAYTKYSGSTTPVGSCDYNKVS